MDREEALEAFRAGKIGAIIAAGTPDSELIDALLRAPSLDVVSIRRADAFAINHRFLERVQYPEGAHDLQANIPDKDLRLLAARVQLVVANPFPPALADLLLQAATEIHSESTAFSAARQFPNANTAAMPLNRAAESYYTEGPPSLQKYLPFRLATWIDRLLVAIVAIASGAVAIFKVIPGLLGLPFQLEVRKAYMDLDDIERAAAAGVDHETLLERLAEQDRITADVKLPMQKYATQWLELRQYLHDMRDRLQGA
jgi:hypothetical protein